jgi:hypothetical protein
MLIGASIGGLFGNIGGSFSIGLAIGVGMGWAFGTILDKSKDDANESPAQSLGGQAEADPPESDSTTDE